MNVPMHGTEHHNVRHPSPATDPSQHEHERVQGGGGVYFRGAIAAAALLPNKGDADDNEEAALLTFHPVDEPDLQVVVSNIFSAAGLASKDIEGAEDEDSNNEEEEANRTMRKRKRSEDVSHVPIYISDEEGDDDDQHDEGGDNDNDEEEEEGSSSSSSAIASDRDLFHRLVTQGAAKVAAAEASAGNKAPLFGLLAAPEADTETVGFLPAYAAPVCGATTGGDSSEACASTSPSPSESEARLDGAKSADKNESHPLDVLCDNDAEKGVEYDYEEDDYDDYETRKRREEENMDEEQLRKKRRVEEEERVARNNLWRQSIKRSMFLEPPGSILSKRATL